MIKIDLFRKCAAREDFDITRIAENFLDHDVNEAEPSNHGWTVTGKIGVR
jgi:hypothetical protein